MADQPEVTAEEGVPPAQQPEPEPAEVRAVWEAPSEERLFLNVPGRSAADKLEACWSRCTNNGQPLGNGEGEDCFHKGDPESEDTNYYPTKNHGTARTLYEQFLVAGPAAADLQIGGEHVFGTDSLAKLKTSFSKPLQDELPLGQGKPIHPNGLVAKCVWTPTAAATELGLTGSFSSESEGIMRVGPAVACGHPDKGGMLVPGFAVKLFREGSAPSANLLTQPHLGGVKDKAYFLNAFSPHAMLPTKADVPSWLVQKAFARVSPFVSFLGLSDFAGWTPSGAPHGAVVTVKAAKNLPKMDGLLIKGKSDPYVTVKCGEPMSPMENFRTPTLDNTEVPEWT